MDIMRYAKKLHDEQWANMEVVVITNNSGFYSTRRSLQASMHCTCERVVHVLVEGSKYMSRWHLYRQPSPLVHW